MGVVRDNPSEEYADNSGNQTGGKALPVAQYLTSHEHGSQYISGHLSAFFEP
jgi:hypothetical protein